MFTKQAKNAYLYIHVTHTESSVAASMKEESVKQTRITKSAYAAEFVANHTRNYVRPQTIRKQDEDIVSIWSYLEFEKIWLCLMYAAFVEGVVEVVVLSKTRMI